MGCRSLRWILLPVLTLVAQSAIAEPIHVDGTSWWLDGSTSKMTDQPKVVLLTGSDERVPSRFGTNDFGQLLLWCEDNKTTAQLYFGGAFMADIDGYGDVTYRIDANPAVKARLQASTSHEHLGFWSGAQAVPFIKSLLGAKDLLVRATPYSENTVEITFHIDGLEKTIDPLRKACKW